MKHVIITIAIAAATLGQANADLLGGRITEHDLNIGGSAGAATTTLPAGHVRNNPEDSVRSLTLGGRLTEQDLDLQQGNSAVSDLAARVENAPQARPRILLGGRLTAADLGREGADGTRPTAFAAGAPTRGFAYR